MRTGPLTEPRFRLVLGGALVSYFGTWAHNLAARWTAATLSPSPLAVTAVEFLQLIPFVLLSIPAGKLADRLDRRRVLISTSLGLASVAALMAALAAIGVLSLPVLYLTTALMGVLGAFQGPAWQATVPRQVPDAEVPRAVALLSMSFNLARAVGPMLGAWLLGHGGAALAFATNAGSYLLIGGVLSRLPPQPPLPITTDVPGSPWDYAPLRRLYVLVFAFGLGAITTLSLLPIVARDALAGDATLYGRLLSSFGLGAVATGLLLSVRRGRPPLGPAAIAAALGCLGLGLATTPLTGMLAAALSGGGWIATQSSANGAVQLVAPAPIRARAMGTYLVAAVSGHTSGSLIWGLCAEHFGLFPTFLIAALWLCGMSVYAFRTSAELSCATS